MNAEKRDAKPRMNGKRRNKNKLYQTVNNKECNKMNENILCRVRYTHITHTGICDGICETNLTCFRHAKVSKRNSRENTRKTYKESVAAYAEQRKHTNTHTNKHNIGNRNSE